MILLVGDAKAKEHIEVIKKNGWGRMLNVGIVKPYMNEPLGFDNHAWADYCNKQPFNSKRFLYRIAKAENLTAHFIVAVTPDKVKGGIKSLLLSNSWITQLNNENRFPWFLAVQDGMDIQDVENSLTKYSYQGLFLGGSDSFKNLCGSQYSRLAKKYGLKFHYGRCGTKKKLRHASALGADSCDSAFPIYWKPRVEVVVKALNFINQNNSEKQIKLTVN